MNPEAAAALLRLTMTALGPVEGDHFYVKVLGLPASKYTPAQSWAHLYTDAARLDKILPADTMRDLALRLATLGFQVELWHYDDAPCTVSAMQLSDDEPGLLRNTFSYRGGNGAHKAAVLAEGRL